jgi:ribosomal protein S18 acetylase RimI-like enzyme
MAHSNISVRRMLEADIPAVSKLHETVFPRQTYSTDWVECTYKSFPMSQCFVGEINEQIIGFVFWTEKSGFRKEAFVELVQGGVDPAHQGTGICTALVEKSMRMVAEKIAERGAVLKNVIVNTRADNHFALNICKKVLKAEQVAVVPGLFTADEVYLVAHNVDELIAAAKVAGNCP